MHGCLIPIILISSKGRARPCRHSVPVTSETIPIVGTAFCTVCATGRGEIAERVKASPFANDAPSNHLLGSGKSQGDDSCQTQETVHIRHYSEQEKQASRRAHFFQQLSWSSGLGVHITIASSSLQWLAEPGTSPTRTGPFVDFFPRITQR
ncbi:hypothetical protein VTK73DRAFT_3694 [Phialemonium thermophilum]|uniref:Uncharacterized protein n=1 Tax=Phialemonium thermophilum TaxID=223376 RepID=A0ABR3WXK7_9PEZI